MKTLRVALFTDANVFAGTERHLIDLARGLKHCGVDVCVACPARSRIARIAASHGIRVLAIKKKGRADWRAVTTLARLLRSGELDIIHAHNGRTAFLAAIAKALARRGRLVFTQHFLTPAHLARKGIRGRLSRLAHRNIARVCDRIVAISYAVRNAMVERNADTEDRIVVVPNGIQQPDVNRLLPPTVVRAELGIGEENFLIVCVARLEPEKDLGTLITAMEIVSARLPRALCVIAGEGSQKPLLQAAIERRGLKKHVVLLGFQEDTTSLVYAADLFVLPSPAEPFGLAILEAMALGKPVIAMRAGGPLEIVEDEVTGVLCPPRAPTVLAESMLCLAEDPCLSIRMGAAGEALFLEAFTAERMVRSTLAAYAVR